ncbi:MAG TPA: DMT family transporter [Candidatus Udaeobacter sp.]|nr:DMT family transporter [Candidatus Udaeobacter sp.]
MLAANFGMLFCALSWGSIIPALGYLLGNWDPYFLAAGRYALAVPPLLLLLRWTEGPVPWFAGLAGWRWWLLGAIGIGLFAPLFTLGLHHANPITVAILSSMSPAVTAIVGRVGFALPMPARMMPGILLAIAGCAYATYDPTLAGSPFDLRGGEILIVAAQVCWSWFSIASQRWMHGCSQLRIAGITTALGSFVLVAVYLLAGAMGAASLPPAAPRGALDIGVFLWLPLVPVLIGNLLWLNGVRKLGAVIAALFMNLMPISAVLITAALGIEPTRQQMIGGAIVLAGILLAQLRRR